MLVNSTSFFFPTNFQKLLFQGYWKSGLCSIELTVYYTILSGWNWLIQLFTTLSRVDGIYWFNCSLHYPEWMKLIDSTVHYTILSGWNWLIQLFTTLSWVDRIDWFNSLPHNLDFKRHLKLVEWYTAFNSISVISRRQFKLFMSFLGLTSTSLGLWSVLPKDTPTKKPRGSSTA